jgi:hypothetical protein
VAVEDRGDLVAPPRDDVRAFIREWELVEHQRWGDQWDDLLDASVTDAIVAEEVHLEGKLSVYLKKGTDGTTARLVYGARPVGLLTEGVRYADSRPSACVNRQA